MQTQYKTQIIEFKTAQNLIKSYKNKKVKVNNKIYSLKPRFYSNGKFFKIVLNDVEFSFDKTNKILLKSSIFNQYKEISIKINKNKSFVFSLSK